MAKVTGMLGRRRIELESITLGKTDVHAVVLITVEVLIKPAEVMALLRQFEKIIEVYQVSAHPISSSACQIFALYRLSKDIFQSAQGEILKRSGAKMIGFTADTLVFCQMGDAEQIQCLYNQLDGVHLLGFARSGYLVDAELLEMSDEDRITRLAA